MISQADGQRGLGLLLNTPYINEARVEASDKEAFAVFDQATGRLLEAISEAFCEDGQE
jgi:hypothetical protein